MKKIESKITISRPHGGGDERICIVLRDDASGISFYKGEMGLADFAAAVTGLSRVSIAGEVRGLEHVGNRSITEKRTIICQDLGYGQEKYSEWLRENAHEPGWLVDTYLGSKGQIDKNSEGVVTLRYSVTRYEESK